MNAEPEACQLYEALRLMRWNRHEIAAMVIPELNSRQVTASIGATELEPGDQTVADVLARADAALYRAKESGRNRVELAQAA